MSGLQRVLFSTRKAQAHCFALVSPAPRAELRVRVLSFFSLHDSLPGYAHLWEEKALHWRREARVAASCRLLVILTLGCSPTREVGYRRLHEPVTASSGPCRTDKQSSRDASRRVLCKASKHTQGPTRTTINIDKGGRNNKGTLNTAKTVCAFLTST